MRKKLDVVELNQRVGMLRQYLLQDVSAEAIDKRAAVEQRGGLVNKALWPYDAVTVCFMAKFSRTGEL
ncbi:unnamed protein product [Taenia asiatica]|uniref:5-formyltetrahydrofolate cyclo-ligase n=1 Tax=Taenia asiatica TaxID=60517 RepID=A0A0R3W169_TAEAS|nr:unnamed protein product [Taenia asiatica]